MTQDHTIRLAYINTLLDGGHTRLSDKTINPTEGYIVGGVTEPTTMNVPTLDFNDSRELDSYEQFKTLWQKYDLQLDEYTSNLYKAGMGVGTWVYEGKIYFDLVQHMYNLDVATDIAMKRGEIAIYDCKKQKDILL
tara:strand:- start:17 stop:424 length:408 start_codon:yes stop_codon:yes gene_type:complete